MKAVGFSLTALLLAAWLALAFDVDDRLLSDASNDELIAIVYTPHVAPGDGVTLRLTLRTGTKSKVRAVRAWHEGAGLRVRRPGGDYLGRVTFGGGDYERFVEVEIPASVEPTERYLVTFQVGFEPPPRNPGSTLAEIHVPVQVRTPDGARAGRIASAAWALGSLAVAFAIAVFAGRQLRRRFALGGDREENELAIWAVCVGIGMHGVLGSWLFAMPLAAATGRVDTWLFIAAIGSWVLLSVFVGWVAGRRVAPGLAGQDAFLRLELRDIAEPGRRYEVSELVHRLDDPSRTWRVRASHKPGKGSIRVERGGGRVWIEHRGPALRLDELRLAQDDGMDLLLEVAHEIARCLGAFTLAQGSAAVRIEPTSTIDEIQMAWIKARMAQLDAMGPFLDSIRSSLDGPNTNR